MDHLTKEDQKDLRAFNIQCEQKALNELHREAIYEDGAPFGGYRLRVGKGDRDGATLSVTCNDITGKPVDAYLCVNAGDLRSLAAQCLAAAQEVEQAQANAA